MEFNKQQKKVFEMISTTNCNLAISAVAGSGKTTTIIEAVNRLPRNLNILFLAFNTDIVKDIKKKIGTVPNVDVKTLHSYGYTAWKKAFNKNVEAPNPQLYESGIEQYITAKTTLQPASQNADDIAEYQRSLNEQISTAKKLFSLCRINLVKNGVAGVEAVAEHHDIELNYNTAQLVANLLAKGYSINKANITQNDKGTACICDFTDMLVTSSQDPQLRKHLWKYDVVLVDECQDLSTAGRELMLAALKPNGKFVAVGDPYQAINGFAGANCDSFQQIASLPNTITLPLSVCYRCGKSIIKEAQSIIPHIEAFDEQIEGKVNTVHNLKNCQYGDTILCRTTAPLVQVALKALGQGKRAYVLGKSIGEDLLQLVTALKAKNLVFLAEKLKAKENKLKARAEKNKDMISIYTNFVDKVNAIMAIAKGCNTIADLKHKIETLFDDNKDKSTYITFATCHKSKGLEFDNVFVLLPDKLPLVWEGQQDWQFEQEQNLRYVTITRAKKTLNWVNISQDDLDLIEF